MNANESQDSQFEKWKNYSYSYQTVETLALLQAKHGVSATQAGPILKKIIDRQLPQVCLITIMLEVDRIIARRMSESENLNLGCDGFSSLAWNCATQGVYPWSFKLYHFSSLIFDNTSENTGKHKSISSTFESILAKGCSDHQAALFPIGFFRFCPERCAQNGKDYGEHIYMRIERRLHLLRRVVETDTYPSTSSETFLTIELEQNIQRMRNSFINIFATQNSSRYGPYKEKYFRVLPFRSWKFPTISLLQKNIKNISIKPSKY